MRKTLSRATLLLSLMIVLIPVPANATASCSGDPCAAVACGPDSVSAAAYGSVYSHSAATAGGWTDQQVKPGGGGTGADMSGGAPMEGEASAGNGLSRAQVTAFCSVTTAMRLLHQITQPSEIRQFVTFSEAPLMFIGCLADDRVRATESFQGRLYLGEGGQFVLFDPDRGDGLALDGLALKFDGASLDAAAPVDLAGFAPTNIVVALDFVDDARVSSCSAVLYV